MILTLLSVCFPVAANTLIVHMNRTGPLKVGMTLRELNTVLHEKFSPPTDADEQGCFYLNPSKYPRLSLMIVNGQLARIDVDESGLATDKGLQVGDAERHVISLYGRRVKVEPSAYGGPEGHYLTVRSSDGKYGIRFETENGRITSFYAGRFDAIQYVEGCE